MVGSGRARPRPATPHQDLRRRRGDSYCEDHLDDEWSPDASVRVPWALLVIGHQVVAIRLADMAIEIEAAWASVRHAARAIDRVDRNRRTLTSMAEVLASETALEVATRAFEIQGGLGAMRQGGVEKILRDAALFFHLDGANDVHRLRVMKELFPGPDR